MTRWLAHPAARIALFPVLFLSLLHATNWLIWVAPLPFSIIGSWSYYVGMIVRTLCIVALQALFRCLGDPDIVWRSWFNLRGALRQTLAGLALMAGVCGLMTLLPYWAGMYDVVIHRQNLSLPWRSATYAIMVAVGEEVVFRGYVLRMIEARVGAGRALLISSVLFGLYHLPIPQPTWEAKAMYAINAFIGGLMLGAGYLLTRRLWLPIALHFMMDFYAFVFLGSGPGFERRWFVLGHQRWDAYIAIWLLAQVFPLMLTAVFLHLTSRRRRAATSAPAGHIPMPV